MGYTLSPSSLSLFSECPRCFWLDIKKKIKRPGGPFPSLPSGMDSVLKRYFESFRAGGKMPPELASLKGVILFSGPELPQWQNNRKGLRWADRRGNVLRGAVDEILVKNGMLAVLDFKTRGFPLKPDTHEHYQDQVDIYSFLLEKNGRRTEPYAYLLFFHPEEVRRNGEVAFHKDLVKMDVSPKSAERLFRRALRALDGRMPKAAKDCDFCRFVKQRGKR
ncbi:MAG: PD-(D/E)XK nuclease family protein [Candidatus Micrarchaeota archaeon]